MNWQKPTKEGIEALNDAAGAIAKGLLPIAAKLAEYDASNPGVVPKRCSGENLHWMLTTICEDRSLPIDKINTWIGFVHGVMAMRDVLDVDAERDRTRPIRHAAYLKAGIVLPATLKMEDNAHPANESALHADTSHGRILDILHPREA